MKKTFVLIAVLLSVSVVVALAAPTTVPTSLSPGDPYRLAFVTSATRDATSSDINTYNTFVSNVANTVPELAALGTTWKAIGSTETVDARDNTNTLPSFAGGSLGVPIFLLNDTKLVDTYDDLWDGSLDLPLNITETGVTFGGGATWTGTKSGGAGARGNQLGDVVVVRGAPEHTDVGWINNSGGFGTADHRLYAISGTLTVNQPPGADAGPDQPSVECTK